MTTADARDLALFAFRFDWNLENETPSLTSMEILANVFVSYPWSIPYPITLHNVLRYTMVEGLGPLNTK